ncbi:hypothetical protein TURU_081151 [Turdus rufiventris]|nr:hypothetical protein TURU_081151 [Turdus rufiventris]
MLKTGKTQNSQGYSGIEGYLLPITLVKENWAPFLGREKSSLNKLANGQKAIEVGAVIFNAFLWSLLQTLSRPLCHSEDPLFNTY